MKFPSDWLPAKPGPETLLNENSRRIYQTRAVLSFTLVAMLILNVIVLAGMVLGQYDFLSLAFSLPLLLFTWIGQVFARARHWQPGAVITPALFFILGLIGSLVSPTPQFSLIFFAISLLLAGILASLRTQVLIAVGALTAYLAPRVLLWNVPVEQLTVLVIMVSASFSAVIFLQWFSAFLIRQALVIVQEQNDLLSQEIRRREKTELSLRESEETRAQILQQMPYPVEGCDPDGTVVMVNDAFVNLFQLPGADRFVGRYNVFKEPLLEELGLSDVVRRAYNGDTLLLPEVRIPANLLMSQKYGVPSHPDEWHEVTIFPIFRKDGTISQVVTIWKDITEQKNTQDELLLNQFAVHNASDEIYWLSLDGTIQYANQAAHRYLGYAQGELTGKKVWLLDTNLTGPIWETFVANLRRERVRVFESGHQTTAGQTYPVEISANYFEYAGQDFIFAYARDITERKHHAYELENLLRDLSMAYEGTLEGWSNTLEMRESGTAHHSQRVVELTLDLAARMGISGEDLVHIRRGALLHDIGKMAIPDCILSKPGSLDDDEWDTMRMHPTYAHRLLKGIPYLTTAMDIPYCHHEKWDGSGYPRGLRGEEIPLAARIFAVIDVWDALLEERPYRAAWSEEQALSYICEQSGRQFDPAVVERFLEMAGNGKLS